MKDLKQAILLLYPDPETGSKVLSVSRKDNHNLLGLPGGKAEEEETLIQGLVREVREEVGIELDPTKLMFLFQDWDGDYDTLTYVYDGVVKDLPKLPFVNKEGAKVEYVTPEQLTNPSSSPFSEYNLKMFKRFIDDPDFIAFHKRIR